MDSNFRTWLERLVIFRRITLAIASFAANPQTPAAETAHAMNVLRRLLNHGPDVDLERHQQIQGDIKDMRDVLTEELQRHDERITRMLRGTYRPEQRDEHHDE